MFQAKILLRIALMDEGKITVNISKYLSKISKILQVLAAIIFSGG
jgi:hypothetical protein